MGEVIRPGSVGKEVFKDTTKALEESRARGGTIQERAESCIAPVMAMVKATEEELEIARTALGPLQAALNAGNEEADGLLNRIYDETWNDVKRPGTDR